MTDDEAIARWIAGVRHGGPDCFADHLRVGDRLALAREPMNPYDPNAVVVLCSVPGAFALRLHDENLEFYYTVWRRD